MNATPNISRRTFLGSAAALVPGFSGSQQLEKDNLYAIMGRHTLRDQQGNIVTAETLQKVYGNKFATLSGTYATCGNGYCQRTNQALAELDGNPNVVHFILSLDPEREGGFSKAQGAMGHQGARNGLKEFVENYLRKKNFVLLYATSEIPAKPSEAKRMLVETGKSIQTLDDVVEHHTPDIILFAPGGKMLDKKNGWNENLDSWNEKLAKARQR